MNIGEIPLANITFEWQPWFQKAANPHVIGERIVALTKGNKGRIYEDALIREAQAADSPLHEFFEWDDRKAAERYRSQQARTLLGGLKVTVKIVDKSDPSLSTKTQVKFLPEDGEKTTVYTVTTTRLEAEDRLFGLPEKEKQQPTTRLERAQQELRVFRVRYGDIEELTTVLDAIDEFLMEEQIKRAA